MNEGPKLYANKPKKAQLKQSQHFKGMETPSSSTPTPSSSSASASSMGGGFGGASKPPEVPRESFARRYKFIWPLLLTFNLAVGGYVLMRTKKKDVATEEETSGAAPAAPAPSATTPAPAITENPSPPPPVRVLEPIPEQQQRELFKWMLEEKRKIKTKDPEEKKRIDEEKAILKQFIRAKSIPGI